MAQSQRAFSPLGATVNINVAATSAQVSLGAGKSAQPVRVFNNGSAVAWIKFGETGVVATVANDIPIGPGVTEVLMAPASGSTIYVAAIAAGATGVIYFTPGIGI